ncbi:MAG: AAA-like domain-containing protein [Eubacteriales bacterium]|nr:AAA-like domain-containing protein [Eubacteriales bacterium]
MKKIFNVSGDCKPELHYMVELSGRLEQMKEMVDAGQYFTVNRARQYGKTTTLRALEQYLKAEYTVISLDFQTLDADKFENGDTFSRAFAKYFLQTLSYTKEGKEEKLKEELAELKAASQDKTAGFSLFELFMCLSNLCAVSVKPMVLLIDEVDSASNNQVFLDFLAQLRGGYMNRDRRPTFQSVILAGVYDVKNIKRKIRPEDAHKMNSPWNTHGGNEESGSLLTFDDCPWDQKECTPFDIAADFLVDMSFSPKDIEGMLNQYEADYHTGMDVPQIAKLLYDYTSGYPFLVSRLCKLMDERLPEREDFPDISAVWTQKGVVEAVGLLLSEKNTLFDSLTGKLTDYPELKAVLYTLLFQGQKILYNPDNEAISTALMFGFVRVEGNSVIVANRIFETRLYNLFLTDPEVQNSDIYRASFQSMNQFIRNGHLDMKRVLEKFVLYFHDLYGDQNQRFYEEDGRRYFLLYLRPIINGTGNYYIEAQTRNMERTDVIIDYNGEQFVIELKIWRGDAYHSRGEEQLRAYLDYYHLDKGYMLSFNFNKKKTPGVREIQIGEKVLIEAVV